MITVTHNTESQQWQATTLAEVIRDLAGGFVGVIGAPLQRPSLLER